MASTQRSNIEVFFRVLGSDRVRRELRDLGNAAGSATGRLANAGRGIGDAIGDAGRQARELARTLSLVGAVGLGALAKGIKDTTDSSAELTSIVLALRAINGEIGNAKGQPLFRGSADGKLSDVNAGSARQTADDLAFVQKVADDAGTSIKNLAQQYIGLQASAGKVGVPLEQVRELFTGLGNAAVVLGIDDEKLGRAFTALNQIAGKSAVTSEDLKGQLAEAVDGAIPLAAEAYGISVEAFLKAVGDAQIDSKEFIDRFGRALNQQYADAALEASNTTRVALGRLSNAFFLAKVSIGNGELDEAFRRIVNAATLLLRTLNANGAFTRFGANLAAAIRPLADRFEQAVDGGYDFERVLNAIARAAKFLVDIFIGVVRAAVRLTDAVGNMRAVFAGYGVQLPKISDVLVGIFDRVLMVTNAIRTRNFTGNGFLDFFVSMYALIEACVFAIGRLIAPKVGPGVRTLEQSFAAIAHWLNQAAAAITTLASGQVSSVLDETGEGILVNLVQAIDRVRQLIASIKQAYALLSGKGAPKGADIDTQKMFAKRDALGDLVSGRENRARINEKGETLYDPEQFAPLFAVRDMLTKLVNFLWDNRGAIGALFDGIVDGFAVVRGTIELLGSIIDWIGDKLAALADRLGPVGKAVVAVGRDLASYFDFSSFAELLAYTIGFLLVMDRALGVVQTIWKVFAAIGGLVKSMAAFLFLSVPQFLVIAAIIGLITFLVLTLVENWELMGDEIGNIGKLLKAGIQNALASFLRSIASLLAKIPGVGGWLEEKANAAASNYDMYADDNRVQAVRDSMAATEARKKRNGGKDPFENGPRGAFDWFKDSGFAGTFSSFGAKQDETNKTLEQIAAQGAPKDDGRRFDADLRRAALEAGGGADANGQFKRPVVIMLSEGGQVELRGRADDPTLDNLAARTAKNRTGPSPAWSQ
ncbi:tape measure protein [Sphingomonas yantingensis]|uniref:Tape measure domain-containing protein n=1 Tax=Sphingomonas yantingensis TaxID=1241761 RepID=A0A7W9ASZ2_9SPHN|nr:tape measure protein [Sphingomonas yantingensis]MBB5700014.1 tape measure domain-containing protein [Sphingomonas yantingensis]